MRGRPFLACLLLPAVGLAGAASSGSNRDNDCCAAILLADGVGAAGVNGGIAMPAECYDRGCSLFGVPNQRQQQQQQKHQQHHQQQEQHQVPSADEKASVTTPGTEVWERQQQPKHVVLHRPDEHQLLPPLPTSPGPKAAEKEARGTPMRAPLSDDGKEDLFHDAASAAAASADAAGAAAAAASTKADAAAAAAVEAKTSASAAGAAEASSSRASGDAAAAASDSAAASAAAAQWHSAAAAAAEESHSAAVAALAAAASAAATAEALPKPHINTSSTMGVSVLVAVVAAIFVGRCCRRAEPPEDRASEVESLVDHLYEDIATLTTRVKRLEVGLDIVKATKADASSLKEEVEALRRVLASKANAVHRGGGGSKGKKRNG